MSDNLTVFGTDYTGVTGIKAKGTGNGTLTYIRPTGTKSISTNGTGIDVTEYAEVDVAVPTGGTPSLQSKSVSYTPTETAQSETVSVDSGYDGLSSVDISVGAISSTYVGSLVPRFTLSGDSDLTPSETRTLAMAEGEYLEGGDLYIAAIPSTYVGSGITRRSSTDLTVGGATVTAPAGYYASSAQKTVASGTEGTPTATKGTVSNHQISITPKVVNSAGYIAGNTKTGTAVTVSASELVDGTLVINSSGTKDVTNYASASVAAGGATASATKGSVSNHSVTITPSVTRTAGYVTAGSANGTAVTVSASELVSGSETKTANGTYDVTNLAELVVNVSGGATGLQIDSVNTSTGSASSSITFTGLQAEPTSFVIYPDDNKSTGSPANVVAVVFDGTTIHGQTASTTSNANAHYDTGFTKSYSNGTLTVTATSASFPSDYWVLDYTYGGSVETANVQVGSGATSITFTGLDDEPEYFTVIFKSDFGTSSGYQRVMWLRKKIDNIYGACMDSSVHLTSDYWTSSYSNGSLTITSQGTNAGGYFHQPGYYELVYAVDGGGSSKNVQVAQSTTRVASTSYTKTASLTCSTTGTYDVYWDCFRSSTSGTSGSQLYIAGSEYGSANTTFTNHAQTNHLTNVSISADQEVAVYVRSRGTNYYAYCGTLTIVQTA